MKICYPWMMEGEYEDGTSVTVGGLDETDCMEQLASKTDKHGELTWYSGVCDEDYANGEYVGRDNFIYD